jgi:hypothetical protein
MGEVQLNKKSSPVSIDEGIAWIFELIEIPRFIL